MASLPLTKTQTSSSPVNVNFSPPWYWNAVWSSVVKPKLWCSCAVSCPTLPVEREEGFALECEDAAVLGEQEIDEVGLVHAVGEAIPLVEVGRARGHLTVGAQRLVRRRFAKRRVDRLLIGPEVGGDETRRRPAVERLEVGMPAVSFAPLKSRTWPTRTSQPDRRRCRSSRLPWACLQVTGSPELVASKLARNEIGGDRTPNGAVPEASTIG